MEHEERWVKTDNLTPWTVYTLCPSHPSFFSHIKTFLSFHCQFILDLNNLQEPMLSKCNPSLRAMLVIFHEVPTRSFKCYSTHHYFTSKEAKTKTDWGAREST